MRVGATKYLTQSTTYGEYTVQIYTNQNQDHAVNDPFVSPWMPFGNIVRTRPDDSLGLNDAAAFQAQIWHRLSTSLTGDTIQFGFTFSDAQMRDLDILQSEWVLYAIVAEIYSDSGVLA